MSVQLFRQKVFAIFDDGTDEGRRVELWMDQRDVSALEKNRGRDIKEIPGVEGGRWCIWHAGHRSMLHDWPHTVEEFERTCIYSDEIKAEPVPPTVPDPGDG